MNLINLVVILIVAVTFTASAHEAHNKKEDKPDTLTIVGRDTIAINGIPIGKVTNKEKHDEKKEEEFVLKPSEQIFAHLHNKMIHFPIALTLVAFLFSLLNIKQQSHCTYQSIKILLGISLLAGISGYFTGNFQITAFIGDPKEWLANTHRLAGIISIILILIWFVTLFIKRIKKYSWTIGLVVIIAISITGFLGGVLAH